MSQILPHFRLRRGQSTNLYPVPSSDPIVGEEEEEKEGAERKEEKRGKHSEEKKRKRRRET